MSFLENESSELNASTPKELLDASLALDNADIKQGKAIFLAMAKAVRADPPGEDFVEILAKRIPTLADYGVRNEAIDVLFALAAGPDAASAEKAMRVVRSAITDSESGYLTVDPMSPRFALSAWDGVRNEIERQKSSLQLRKQYVLAFGEHALKDERFVKSGYFEEFIRASAAPRVFCENDVAQNIFKVSGMLVQAYPSVANLDIVLSTADILNESVNVRVRCEGVKFLSIIAAGSPGLIGADLTRKLTRLYDHVWEVRFSLASVDVRETCVGLNFIFAVAEREKRLAAEEGEKEAPRFLGRLRKKKAPVEVSGTEIYQREIEKALARFEPAYPFPAATPICRREHRGGNGYAHESRIYCDDGWVDVRGTAEKPTVEERIAQREKVAPSDVNGLVIEDTVEGFVSWAEEQRLRVVFIRKAPSGSAPSIPAAPRGPQPA